MDEGWVFKGELEWEFGSISPIGTFSSVKMYDANNNEIEIPKCDKCESFKQELISPSAVAWVCPQC